MQHLGWLNSVLPILTLAAIAGAGLQQSRVKDLGGQLVESRAEIGDKDRRIADRDRQIAEKDTQIETQRRDAEVKAESLKRDMEALARMVTGEAHLVALEQKLDEHHGEAKTHWSFDEELLAQIRDAMNNLVTEFSKGNAE